MKRPLLYLPVILAVIGCLLAADTACASQPMKDSRSGVRPKPAPADGYDETAVFKTEAPAAPQGGGLASLLGTGMGAAEEETAEELKERFVAARESLGESYAEFPALSAVLMHPDARRDMDEWRAREKELAAQAAALGQKLEAAAGAETAPAALVEEVDAYEARAEELSDLISQWQELAEPEEEAAAETEIQDETGTETTEEEETT